MAGTYSSPVWNSPGTNSILAPFSNPVGAGLTAAGDVYSADAGNTALANGIAPYDALQAAYQDLQNAEFGIMPPNPNQIAAPPTPTPVTGGPGEGPNNPPPGVSPTPPPGAVPGDPAYTAWLEALYPGLNVPAPTPTGSPTRYGVL